MIPKVSIITVAKNSEKTIERTIQSVMMQTFKNIEYIIIDGASSDKTLEIAKKYQKNNGSTIKIVSEPDFGIYDAMNKGIKLSTGALIGILNSDDWYEVDAVEKIVEAYKENSEALLYGMIRTFENGKEFMTFTVTPEFMQRNMIPHPSCFVPRSLYSKYGFFSTEYKYASDLDFLLRLYKNDVPFIKINCIIANFDTGGITKKEHFKCLKETHKILHLYEYLTSKKFYTERMKARFKEFLFKVVGL